MTCATEVALVIRMLSEGPAQCDGSGTQVLYYTFDDPSNRYHDDSGRGHTGAIAPVGGASMVPGVVAAGGGGVGRAPTSLIAPGNTGVEEYSTADAADALTSQDAMTAIAWIYVPPRSSRHADPGDCVEGTIFSKGEQTGSRSTTTMAACSSRTHFIAPAPASRFRPGRSLPTPGTKSHSGVQVFRAAITMYLDGVRFGAAFLSDAVPDNAATLSIGNFGFHGPWECAVQR